MHLQRWIKHNDPLHIEPLTGRPPKNGVPGYDSIHKRLTRERGRAATFACTGCGAPAAHWALALTDAPLYDERNGMGYSLDPDDYTTLCVPCHHEQDDIGIGSTLGRDALGRITRA